MIRIEYKENGNRIETKWINETTESSSNMGRLLLDPISFRDLRCGLEALDNYGTRYKFIEKKDV